MSTPLTQAAALLTVTPQQFAAICDETLLQVGASVRRLKALSSPDAAQRLELYDDAVTALANAAARCSLGREVHPDIAFRQVAERCEQRIEAFSVELSLDRDLYEALASIEPQALDEVTRHWLTKTLTEFRRAGVDRDESTRQRVKALNEELVRLGQAFGRNIRDDVRTVRVWPAELEGLPPDWLAAHPPAGDGLVTVTTNPPDIGPVMTYARKRDVREQLWRAYRTRAFPANVEVLKTMLAKRFELATLLGYSSWADFALETKMAKNARTAAAFIEKGRSATLVRAERDLATLLARKQQDVPGAKSVEPWEFEFYEDRVRNEQFGLDSQVLREFFEYDSVKNGVMSITAKLFGVRFVRRDGVRAWHPDVETFDVYEGETLLGRFHLDMHPRENKYKHAAEFGLTVGRAGKELPEAVLVCNFPKAPGLLQHSEVETFFHEFGHLLHEIFGGRQRWGGVSGIKTEWDFVEVPSMLLQEWPLDGEVLRSFARHHKTQAAIPTELVAQLKRAKSFGVGLQSRRQFFLAAVSLAYHQRPPGFDTGALLREIQTSFEPFRQEFVEGTHFELSFGHLDGYSAAYYTYQWSTVIAKDLLSRFRPEGLLSSDVATAYRRAVLDPGGSIEATKLVERFLGRPSQFDAYQHWLDEAPPL
jgi:thimet oligopeptidase